MRVVLLAAALGMLVASPAGAVTWQEAFAADRDTVVFFDADGTLFRAPFDLAARETLWTPVAGQRLVRVRVSPDGRRVAWLTRDGDQDTTRLWVDGTQAQGPRGRFFALLPGAYGRVHAEPGVPTIEDAGIRGARLVEPTPRMRRRASNTLEWTPDSRAVVFGYDDGVAAIPADAGTGFGVTRALAVGLESLDPAPIYLVDAVVLREHMKYVRPEGPGVHPSEAPTTLEDGRPIDAMELAHPNVLLARGAEPGTYLLYPLPHRWRVFPASDLAPGRPRAQSPGTVWWGSGSRVRAIRTNDPAPTEEARAAGPVVWVGYDETRGSVMWAGGREVGRKAEDGGPLGVVLRAAVQIHAALPSGSGARVGFVAGDSLLVWSRASGGVERVAQNGLHPTALLDTPAGWRVVTEGGADGPGLAGADASGRLAALEVPRVKGGTFVSISGGNRLVLFDPGARPPAELHVLDTASARWTTVANPGIAGWEPLAP